MRTALTIMMALLLPALAWAQPAIDFAVTSHDFGQVQQGQVLKHVFEFQNTGSAELVIEKLEAT